MFMCVTITLGKLKTLAFQGQVLHVNLTYYPLFRGGSCCSDHLILLVY